MKIAVADAAVGDGDLDFLRAQLAGVVMEGQEFRSRRMCCKSLNLCHSLSGFLIGGCEQKCRLC